VVSIIQFLADFVIGLDIHGLLHTHIYLPSSSLFTGLIPQKDLGSSPQMLKVRPMFLFINPQSMLRDSVPWPKARRWSTMLYRIRARAKPRM